jgi:glycosyltransferase involved in cell wall biosynthesis
MKIAVLSFDFDRIGGIERVALDIVHSLKKREEVETLSLKDYQKSEGWRLFRAIYNRVSAPGKVKNRLDEMKPDIVIVMHPFILKYIGEMRSYRVVCWTHGIDVFGKNGKKVEKLLKTRCDRIVAVSSFTKDRMVEDLDIDDSLVDVVNNCVDISDFIYSRTDDSLPFRILTVGRLEKSESYKGHEVVMESMRILIDRGMDILYDIAGDGDGRDSLRSLSRELGIEDRVRFHGAVDSEELKRLYRKSHLFVMPSCYEIKMDGSATGEGFGIVYIEAGATGRAVIGCDTGGQTDYIKDGKNGFLCRPVPEEIAKRIETLYRDRDLLKRMGDRGREDVENGFSPEIFEKNLSRVVECAVYSE